MRRQANPALSIQPIMHIKFYKNAWYITRYSPFLIPVLCIPRKPSIVWNGITSICAKIKGYSVNWVDRKVTKRVALEGDGSGCLVEGRDQGEVHVLIAAMVTACHEHLEAAMTEKPVLGFLNSEKDFGWDFKSRYSMTLYYRLCVAFASLHRTLVR